MSNAQGVKGGQAVRPGGRTATPTWRLVFVRELIELWLGGKASILLLIYCILLGILTYVMASNSELSLIPPQEMVYELLKAAMSVGLFICLVISSDSISGERERSTLEGLLLTPTSRRQIVVGKFLAAISAWPVALAVTIPYMKVLSQGNEVFGQAVPWGAVVGTLLAPGFTALGMFVSFWSNTNKTSYFVSLGIYVVFLLPTQLPGHAQSGAMGQLLQKANPMSASAHFLSKLLVNNRTLGEFWTWLAAPALFSGLILGLLFWYASGLRLEGGGKAGRLRSYVGRLAGLPAIVWLVAALHASSALAAPAQEQHGERQSQPAVSTGQPLAISIDMAQKTVKAGDHILYKTVVTNNGLERTVPLCIAMNIINLNAAGDVVDPEDWSPQRTQYIETLDAGQSASLSWRVNAILDGDYLVYMVVIPEPDGPEATSQPIASSGIHLTVTPFTRLNPGGVLPYAIGGPIVLILGILALNRLRRRKIDSGGS